MRNLFWLLALATLAFTGCKNNKPVVDPLNDTQWRLIALQTNETGKVDVPEEVTFNLNIKNNAIWGSTTCNRFSGQYTSSQGDFTLSPLSMTRMICAANMDMEAGFLSLLDQARDFTLSGEDLELVSDAGILYFRQVPGAKAKPVPGREKLLEQLDQTFATAGNLTNTHVFSIVRAVKLEDYPFLGQQLSADFYSCFDPATASQFEQLPWGVYMLGKVEKFFLLRVPDQNASNTIQLFQKTPQGLTRLLTLAAAACPEEGVNCVQQDAWLEDLNKDGLTDVVVRQIETDNSGAISTDRFTVYRQTTEGSLTPANELPINRNKYQLQQLF